MPSKKESNVFDVETSCRQTEDESPLKRNPLEQMAT